MLQKPRAPCTTRMAWCPGGRTRAKALSTAPSSTFSAAVIAPPAEMRWLSVMTLLASGTQMWMRLMSSIAARPGLYSTMFSKSSSPSSKTWSCV